MNLTQSSGLAQSREGILRRDNFKCVKCEKPCGRDEADIHHLLPRSAGGSDDPSNPVTLCDGCHAAHHPKLAAGLARRAIERWAVSLPGGWIDRVRYLRRAKVLGPALRLFGLDRFRDGQLAVVQAALCRVDQFWLSVRRVLARRCAFNCRQSCGDKSSVVVSPLKALMGEQVSALLRRKFHPASSIATSIPMRGAFATGC